MRLRIVSTCDLNDIFAALSRQGADIVRADFNEPESLLDAFRGAYAVFGMTNCE